MRQSPSSAIRNLGIGQAMPEPRALLQWVYLWRVVVAAVVFVAASFYFTALPAAWILALAIATILSVVVAAASFWYTHALERKAGLTFLYIQALFDLALVTTIVHVTGGTESDFAALYILVIAVSAVLMPVGPSLLVTILACVLYIADIVWGHQFELTLVAGLQLLVFASVAVATGWLAGRVRAIGAEHEVLKDEVQRLQLEASDILRYISSGVVTVDGDGVLLYANPSAEALLGIAVADWVNRPCMEMLLTRSPELHGAILHTQRGDRDTLRAEGEIIRSGRKVPIGLTTTAVRLGGNRTPSVTAIFSDISDQKRLEQLHLRTERLEAVAELSASLAHEIKNPLASIRSSVEQLARSARANIDEDERFLAQLVLRESDRLARILTEFLDFSRVRVTRYRPVDLRDVARAAADVVREHPDCAPGADICLVAQPILLEGDEDLLHRVVQNLVLNAVQAGGAEARVTVEIRDAQPGELPRQARLESPVLLRVSDNGPGIPDELRERLFEPFVTGRRGGTGLGLAIVLRAVQAHRGLVWVDTETGRGAVFTVLLPARGAAEAAA